MTKQFDVTRPKVRQDLSEVRASGPVEAIKGRGTFAHSPHTVAPATRARGVRRPADGRDVKAEGTRWTDAEPPVAARTDTPLTLAELIRIPPGEPMSTYDALQTADHGHLRQPHRTYVPFSVLIDTKYEEETPPPAPELYTPLSDQGHELHFTESAPAGLYPTRLRRYDPPTGSRGSTPSMCPSPRRTSPSPWRSSTFRTRS